ncbi:MAG: InlB B-repeat-containing protein [Prevotella sp.]|nr:InlB B-repeat-containing protein [Prevotella sp.]
MKKLFTLLTLLAFVVGGVKAQTASDVYLDLANYATIDEAGFGTNNSSSALSYYDEETNWLTVCGYVASVSTSKQKWITTAGSPGADSSKGGWTATDVFKGHSAYFSSGYRTLCVQKAKTISFKVTSCTEIRAYVMSRSKNASDRYVYLDLYELDSDGNRISDTPVSTQTASTYNKAVVLKADNLSSSKIYEAFVRAGSANNEFLYEIAFLAETDTRTASSVAFAETSGTANLGESFALPTVTTNPTGLTVTYASSNTDVAEVDATTGAVTVKAIGTTNITATFAGDESYKKSSATYALTVVDPNAFDISATWSMADGAESVGMPGADETVMKTDWLMASNIAIHATPTATYGGTAVTQFAPKTTAADNERVDGNYIEFSMTPWKGLTFLPTAVSFEAFKVGTDGPKIDADFIDGEGNTIKLETSAAITRNNKIGQEGQANQVHSHAITTAVASTKAVKLRIYVRSCAPDKGVAFGNIVISGTASGEATELTSYTITTSLNIEGAGTVSPILGANSVYETNDLRLTATANEGYEFVNWTIDGESQTGNPYIIKNITANHTAVANFKQLLAVTFAAGEGTGVVPANVYGNEGATITVPKSYFLAKSGYTLVGWNDGTTTYKAGQTFTMPANNVTLTAVFEENTEALSFSLASATVTWDFQQKNIGVFTSANSGTFVAQATVNDKTIDVPMTFDKQIPNASWTDWANIGNKPTLTIPAVKGMQITLLTFTSPSTTTIAGATNYEVTGSSAPYTAKYTYTGSDETVAIVLNDGSYIRSISVEYPKTHTYVDVTSVGYRTFASGSALDFTGGVEGLTAYRATVSGDNVSFVEIDGAVPAGEGMLLKADEGRYYIPLATGTPDAIENAFVGVTTATEVEAGIFVLMNEDGVVGFYKTKNAFTVGANTAYLPATTTARTFIGLDDETTGISAALMNGERVNGEVYNLNGQRVAQPAKGLYIVNGKKVIINK